MYWDGNGLKIDVVVWCQSKIPDKNSVIEKQGKNWNVHIDGCVITVNASKEATVANFATVQMEGDRQVERSIEYYNLDVIISVKGLRER